MTTPSTSSSTTPNRLYLEALLHYDRGEYDQAKDLAEQSLALQGGGGEEQRTQERSQEEGLRSRGQENAGPLSSRGSGDRKSNDLGNEASRRVDHVLFCNTLLVLGNVAAATGKIRDAVSLYATCEVYLQDHFGPDFLGVATCKLNRALTLYETIQNGGDEEGEEEGEDGTRGRGSSPIASRSPEEKESEVLSLLESCKSILQHTFGQNRLLLADVHHNVGCILFQRGQFSDSMKEFVKSLKIREKFSDDHGEVDQALCLTMVAIASLLRLEGGGINLAEAIRIFEAVADLEIHLLGPISLQRAETLGLLASTKEEVGHLQGAREYLSQIVNIKAQLLGEDHDETQDAALKLVAVEDLMEANAAAVADRAAHAGGVLPSPTRPTGQSSGIKPVDPRTMGRGQELGQTMGEYSLEDDDQMILRKHHHQAALNSTTAGTSITHQISMSTVASQPTRSAAAGLPPRAPPNQ